MTGPLTGIFIIAPLHDELTRQIQEVTKRFDRKLAASKPPHVTLAGSSGVGPIPESISVDQLSEFLAPVAAASTPLTLHFRPPVRFMQTDIIVLPLAPHGPLRALHDRIATCGLPFQSARYTFS